MSRRDAVLILVVDDTSLRLEGATFEALAAQQPIQVDVNGEKFEGYVRKIQRGYRGTEVEIWLPSKEQRIEPINGIDCCGPK